MILINNNDDDDNNNIIIIILIINNAPIYKYYKTSVGTKMQSSKT